MTSAAPFTMAMDFVPDESHRTFHGTVTITKTTLTVFKTSSAAATAMRDPATNERSTFIGVCSLPLIQFYRHKNAITLMRGSSFLFDNAAVTAGLRRTDASIRSSSSSRSRSDNPTMWERLQMRCATLSDCDRVVEVLLSRSAEETFRPPMPRDTETHGSTASSVDSYSRHNERGHDARPRSRSSRHNSPRQNRHAHEESTRGPASRDARTSSRAATPQTEVSTPRSSRLPSRRENDDTATQSSVTRTDVSTPRSSRLPSRRENDDVTSVTMTTPSQSIRSSQQRVAPGRTTASTAVSTPSRTSPRKHTGSSERRRDHSSSHRRAAVDPAEREFAAAATVRPQSNGHGGGHHHRSPSRPSTTRSPHRSATATEATPRSTRHGTSPRTHSASHRHVSPRTDGPDYSASVSPRSTVSRRHKTEQEMFVRSVQKLQHHRLHFMQYLHKEMVHQAYLAEEAKVKAAMAEASAARRRTASANNSPSRRANESSAAAEAARLREMENRLAQVEALHREAEREREEAARLRREYEWKNEELNARLGSHPMPEGSRGVSVNSSVIGNQRNGSAYAAGQLMVVPQPNGANHNGGSSYPLMQHPGFTSSVEWALVHDPAAQPRPDDVDLGTAIIDRYVFGEEWARVYPAYEADVRFNAQIDVCLAMKLPRRLVTITNLVVDRPGLRVTAEIRYDRAKIERDGVERRMNGCPFRFLQRFYDMRDLFDPLNANNAPAVKGRQGSGTPRALTAGTSRRSSRAISAQRRRSDVPHTRNSDVSTLSDDFDAEERRDHYAGRMEDRVRAAEERLARRRRRMQGELRRQLADNVAQLVQDEEFKRDSLDYAEARERQRIGQEARARGRATLTTSMANLAEEERVERAAIEVGAARQLHVLMGGHRRQLTLLGLAASEAERRRQIAGQEAEERGDLNLMINPAREAQRKEAERRARGAELRAGRGGDGGNARLEASMADLVSDEIADRAVIRSQAMAALLDLLYRSPAPMSRDGRRAPSSIHAPSTMRALMRELTVEEAEGRRQLMADEHRRRCLYEQDDVVKREMVSRVAIEEAEMDARDAMLDGMMAQNREQLERRLGDREQLAALLNEEQFYRRTILSDEQDAFEVLAELFAAGLKDILTRVPESADDDEDLRRRRFSTQRQAKPFHYMTFSPEDMDFPPSAVLAIEGIVGCSINKNLEVVSVARPLPKAEEEDLQLQAGDMILDVAGHSLHSLSHLREVLSNRAMQIQEEALEEFPSVPVDQRTVNPALQKYIEVLCEHHNFLVQVLRGCEIYQIIVRS